METSGADRTRLDSNRHLGTDGQGFATLYDAAVRKLIMMVALSACNTVVAPTPDSGPTTHASELGKSISDEALPSQHEVVLLSQFETRYAYGGNRGKNIERAMIRSLKVLPGAVVSFNSAVGPRTSENGFLKAPVIFKGEMTDGEGGGVCQVSSTLHGAVRLAGLAVIARTPHSRPSSYIPIGMDSTVVWPDVDLKIKNPFAYPVELKMSSFPSKHALEKVLRAEVWGPADPRPAPSYIFSVGKKKDVFDRLVRRPDGGAPDGVRKVQKGLNGQEVVSVLTWPDGVKETWKSSYPPTNEIWEVGKGAADDLDGWSPPLDGWHADAGPCDAGR